MAYHRSVSMPQIETWSSKTLSSLYVDVGLSETEFNEEICDWTGAMDSTVRQSLKFEKPIGTH